jgi:Rieske Fe-S protein
VTFDRRQIVTMAAIGVVAVTVTTLFGGCSRRKAPDVAEAPINFLGDSRKPGDPLYSAAAAAYVAVVPESTYADAKAAWGAALDPATSDGIIALSEDCPHDGVALQYCSKTSVTGYVCPACKSWFTRLGDRAVGPAVRGMDRRKVSINDAGDLLIDPIGKIDGPSKTIARPNGWIDVSGCLTESVLPPNQRRRPTT